MPVKAKSRWMSRTFWFNLLSAALATVLMLQEAMAVFPESEWTVQVLTVLALVNAVGNVVLRHLTAVPIQGTRAAVKAGADL